MGSMIGKFSMIPGIGTAVGHVVTQAKTDAALTHELQTNPRAALEKLARRKLTDEEFSAAMAELRSQAPHLVAKAGPK